LIWNRYNEAFIEFEGFMKIRLPVIPKNCKHNAHMYYLLLNSMADRDKFIEDIKIKGVNCIFHYIPLHLSDAGIKYGKSCENLDITEKYANRLVRLPLWVDLTEEKQRKIIDAVFETLSRLQ